MGNLPLVKDIWTDCSVCDPNPQCWSVFCFAGFGTDRLRCKEAMKTAGRENLNRWANVSSHRAPGADGQNRSCSITWAEKQETFQPAQRCFFLTSPFIEQIRS